MTILSFHPVKSITTGEGGAILTNRNDFYERLIAFRNHGIQKNGFNNKSAGEWYYEMRMLGYNYRMTDIHAALGISQLKKLNKFVLRRRNIARAYDKAFKGNCFFDIPDEGHNIRSAYHLYPIRLKDKYKKRKKMIFSDLRKNGLGVQVHYMPVYQHPYYKKLKFSLMACSSADDFYKREISIPIYPSMTEKDFSFVIKTVLRTFSEIR
jgi:dTDP-4-amino-4,6-dideoxygalactose transaminase